MVSLTQSVPFYTRHPGARGTWFHRAHADGAVVEVFVPAGPAKDNDAFCARRWRLQDVIDEAGPGGFRAAAAFVAAVTALHGAVAAALAPPAGR